MGVREFVISDTHFNHKNIIEYENRPFKTVEEMNEAMIENWNRVVDKHDKVYILGDFVFGNKEYIEGLIKRLNGYKILIMGNHDIRIRKQPNWWIDRGFDEAYKGRYIKDDFIVMEHRPTDIEEMLNSDYFYLYGHIHTKSDRDTINCYSACLCVERWDYTPVLLDEILKRAGVGDMVNNLL